MEEKTKAELKAKIDKLEQCVRVLRKELVKCYTVMSSSQTMLDQVFDDPAGIDVCGRD